jgi:NAD(P)-dependent dehydrogenase (short-subunit alcohol dehydrogenase family)
MSDTERTIVITGASSGFGAAAVRAFADRGDRVWGTMRDTAGRNAAKKAELEGYSPRITIAEMDVTSDASVADGFAAILAEGPRRHPDQQRGHHVYRHDRGLQRRAGRGTDGHQLFRGHPRDAGGAAVDARGRSGLIINTSSIAGRVSVPFFGTYCATKHALEAYSQSLRYEVAPFGIDVALVEPGPFPSNLLAAGKPPARADVLASYGDLGQVPAMIAGFAQMLASDEAPDPQLVVDAYLSLADAAPGKRPTRTVVGITWGVDEVNAFTQPRQDALLKEMQLDTVLGGADA